MTIVSTDCFAMLYSATKTFATQTAFFTQHDVVAAVDVQPCDSQVKHLTSIHQEDQGHTATGSY